MNKFASIAILTAMLQIPVFAGPISEDDHAYIALGSTSPVTIPVLANDGDDPTGEPLVGATVSITGPAALKGTVTTDGTTVTYTPHVGSTGRDEFYYSVSVTTDGVTETSEASVVIEFVRPRVGTFGGFVYSGTEVVGLATVRVPISTLGLHFSGTVRVGSKVYPIRGLLDEAGNATVPVPSRTGATASAVVSIPESGEGSVTLTDGPNTFTVSLAKNPWTPLRRSGPAQHYTTALHASPSSGGPGFASLKVSARLSLMSMSGLLPNGKAFSGSTFQISETSYIVYSRQAGYVLGAAHGTISLSSTTTSDLQGALNWTLPSGESATLSLEGSKFVRQVDPLALNAARTGIFAGTGGGLPDTSESVTLALNNFGPLLPNGGLQLVHNQLKGQRRDGANKLVESHLGVVLQKQNKAIGIGRRIPTRYVTLTPDL